MIRRERVTYRPILATDRLSYFHHSLMRIDGYGVGSSGYVVYGCGYVVCRSGYVVCVQS